MKYPSNMQNKANNNQGKIFEKLIELGCQKYARANKAFIEKIPEDFHPQKIDKTNGKATGYYKAKAQPDFQGTLQGGRSICFEAKCTRADRIKSSVITKNQAECLTMHSDLGAYVGVCCQINKTVAFVPWDTWKNMKEIYGRMYITEEEAKVYQIPSPMYIDFLYLHELGVC